MTRNTLHVSSFVSSFLLSLASAAAQQPPAPPNLKWEVFTGLVAQGPPTDLTKFWHPQPVSNMALTDAGGHMTMNFTAATNTTLVWSKQYSSGIIPSDQPRYLAVRFDLDVQTPPPDGEIRMSLEWKTSSGGSAQRLIWWYVRPEQGWQTVIVDLKHPTLMPAGGPPPGDKNLTQCFRNSSGEAWAVDFLTRYGLRVGDFSSGDDGAAIANAASFCRIDRIAFLDDYDGYQKQIFADYFLGLNRPQVDGLSNVWTLFYLPTNPPRLPETAPVETEVRWSGTSYATSDELEVAGSLYPLIGPYSTADRDVQEYHLLLAKAAGLDGFLCETVSTAQPIFDQDGDPWPPGQPNWPLSPEATILPGFASLAAQYGVHVGVHWINGSTFPWYRNLFSNHGLTLTWTRAEHLAQNEYDLKWFLENVYPVAGPKVGPRDLVPFFNAWHACPGEAADPKDWICFTPAEISTIKSNLYTAGHKPLVLIQPNDGGSILPSPTNEYLGVVDGYFGWLRFGSTVPPAPLTHYSDTAEQVSYLQNLFSSAVSLKNAGTIEMHMGSALPHFDDHKGLAWGRNEKRYVPDGGGSTLTSTLEKSLNQTSTKTGTDTAMVITWNDHEEATQLEPSMEFGYTEIDAAATRIATWKGTTPKHDLMRLPERLLSVRRRIGLLKAAGLSTGPPPTIPPTPPTPLAQAIALADAAGFAIADGDFAQASAAVVAVETSVGDLLATLRSTPINLSWDCSQTVGPFTLETVGNVVCDADGALPMASIGFSFPQPSPLAAGIFVGTVSFEYFDSGSGHVVAVVDHPDVDPPTSDFSRDAVIYHGKLRGANAWRWQQFDLVNARFINHLSRGNKIVSLRFDQWYGASNTRMRKLRIQGQVFKAQSL